MVKEYRKVKVHNISEVNSKSTVHEIISDLNFHKMFAHWVQKIITEEHKSKRMTSHLKIFAVSITIDAIPPSTHRQGIFMSILSGNLVQLPAE
jgi:ribosomal protein L13